MSFPKAILVNAYRNWKRKHVNSTISIVFQPYLTNLSKTKSLTQNQRKFLSSTSLNSNESELKNFFDQLGKKLNVRKWEDWYRTKSSDITEMDGGDKILSKFDSYINAIKTAFPEFPWKTWRFIQIPQQYWSDTSTHREFFDWFSQQFNIKKWEDWYQVKKTDIVDKGGSGLLSLYKDSHAFALMSIYKEHPWNLWKFDQLPIGYWDDSKNLTEFMDQLGKLLHIQNLEEWYQVKKEDVEKTGYSSMLGNNGGLIRFLTKRYPAHEWNFDKIPKPEAHEILYKAAKDIFPESNMLVDNFHQGQSRAQRKIEYHAFFPDKKVAFIYFGEHHYKNHFMYGNVDIIKQQDSEKREAARKEKVTLIEVPYWWDKSSNSLAATVYKFRPDIVQNPKCSPIPEQSPEKKMQLDPTGWWLSEKYDGVRAYWDGSGKLYYRTGKEIHAPRSFLRLLPVGLPLDGELWCGYNTFNECNRIISHQGKSSEFEWKKINYMVFDAPTQNALRYEERMDLLRRTIATDNPQVKVVDVFTCQGNDHLMKSYKDLKASGAEGVVLRKPGSFYHDAGSFFTLKDLAEKEIQDKHQEKYSNFIHFVYSKEPLNPAPKSIQYGKLKFEEIGVTVENPPAYSVSYGNRMGSVPKCRGCQMKFADRGQLRLQVDGTFTPHAIPRQGKVNFCLKIPCIESALLVDKSRREPVVYYPDFDARIGIPMDIRDEVSKELPRDMEGVEFVLL